MASEVSGPTPFMFIKELLKTELFQDCNSETLPLHAARRKLTRDFILLVLTLLRPAGLINLANFSSVEDIIFLHDNMSDEMSSSNTISTFFQEVF